MDTIKIILMLCLSAYFAYKLSIFYDELIQKYVFVHKKRREMLNNPFQQFDAPKNCGYILLIVSVIYILAASEGLYYLSTHSESFRMSKYSSIVLASIACGFLFKALFQKYETNNTEKNTLPLIASIFFVALLSGFFSIFLEITR